jgi:hypothetical protein
MKYSALFVILFFSLSLRAQKIKYTYEISKNDTLLVGNIPDVVVKEAPNFKTHEEYTTYLRYKRYAEKYIRMLFKP